MGKVLRVVLLPVAVLVAIGFAVSFGMREFGSTMRDYWEAW